MLRLRLAGLAVAFGLVFTMSGCCSFCENGQFRLFRNSSYRPGWFNGNGNAAECECHNAHMPGMLEGGGHGPIMPTPIGANQTMPIPITNVPAMQPPHVFKVPTAPTTPYVPPIN